MAQIKLKLQGGSLGMGVMFNLDPILKFCGPAGGSKQGISINLRNFYLFGN